MYKISIIVPVYNQEDTLQRAFDSIKNQSFGFENLEVIFVDDASTDNSANIIKKSGSWYSYKETRLGQGREAAKTSIKDNPELGEELEKLIFEALKVNK